MMSIDWFTVIAQIINFLILVWLLKRFLYRPILDAIDAREQHIAKTLADAESKENEAQKQRDLFSHKNNEFEQQRNTLLLSAKEAATAESQRLLEEARQAAELLSLKQQASLQRDQQRLSAQLSRKTQQEVFAISRQTLRDLANVDLEAQMLKIFLTQLTELDEENKTTLNKAISTSSNALRIRSTFTLDSEQQKQIINTLNDSSILNTEVTFETHPEVISGIELSINGQKLAWSIAHYIDSLEKHLKQILQSPLQHDLTKKTIREEPKQQQTASKESDVSTKNSNCGYE